MPIFIGFRAAVTFEYEMAAPETFRYELSEKEDYGQAFQSAIFRAHKEKRVAPRSKVTSMVCVVEALDAAQAELARTGIAA